MWVSWQWQRAHCNKREGNSHHYCLEMIGCGFRHVSSPISHWTKPYQHPPTAGCWFSGEENCSLSKVVVMAFCLKIEIGHMESSLLKLCFMMSQHLGCQCSIVFFCGCRRWGWNKYSSQFSKQHHTGNFTQRILDQEDSNHQEGIQVRYTQYRDVVQ